jgi:hypothetical protein
MGCVNTLRVMAVFVVVSGAWAKTAGSDDRKSYSTKIYETYSDAFHP